MGPGIGPVRSHPSSLAFGIPPELNGEQSPEFRGALEAFLQQELQLEVHVHEAVSCDDLASRLHTGLLDAAWLPPVLFVELERTKSVQPVVCSQRKGGIERHAVFFTTIDSDIATVRDIRGRSVAWVSPDSTCGYLLPRLQLAAQGIDPTTAFQEEVFFRSHDGVVRAVANRATDLGASYIEVHRSQPRHVVRAGWQPPPAQVDPTYIQWLDPFGPVPGDAVVVRTGVSDKLAAALRRAFAGAVGSEPTRSIPRGHVGVAKFVPFEAANYDVLRRAMEAAEGLGLEVAASLRPSAL